MVDLFNSKAEFIMPDLTALPAEERQRLEPIRVAHEAHEAIRSELAAAESAVEKDLAAIAEAENIVAKFPRPSFMDLHRAMVATGRHPGK
jgi:hypothetical protein